MAGASVAAVMEVLAAAGVTVVAMAAKVRVAAKVRLVAREVEGSEVEGSAVGGGRRTPAGRCGFWSQRWWADLGDATRRRRRRRRRRRGYSGGEDVVARADEGVEGRRGLAMCG